VSDENDGKAVMAIANELMAKLEANGIKLEMKGLGPALIVLGMTVSAKNGERQSAMQAVVAAGTVSGILSKPGEAFAKMRENPEALAAFLKQVLGPESTVQMGYGEPPSEERKPRRFPWR
jgi:hypothetical protein